ncbi:MAG: AMP-binding protein, partial [Desulfobacterales bacterium]|nr:AMP-binding protein [Desulfobacterales bacterium]
MLPELSYPRQRLGWLLYNAAERFPDRVACHYYAERLTYGELLDRARRLSEVFIREGLQPGDRVGILLPNLPETYVALFATWMAGGVVVSLSPLMVADEVQSLLQATDCRIVVALDVLSPLLCQGGNSPPVVVLTTLSGRLTQLEQLGYAWVRLRKLGFSGVCPNSRVIEFDDSICSIKAVRDRADVGGVHEAAFILPTGGTTGKPKAVTLSHSNLMAQAFQLSHWSGVSNGTESILGVLPIFHSYGLSTLVMMGTMIGATLILHHRFRPASAARLIEQCRPTFLFAVPAMLSALNSSVLRHGSHDLSSLRAVISGGSALPPSVADEFREHTGAVVVEGYGL